MKRLAREHPELLDEAVRLQFEDAAGHTKVGRYMSSPEGPTLVKEDIHPRDRRSALELIRDTMDGKPTQAIDVDGMPTAQVIIASATPGGDPAYPPEILEMLNRELRGETEEPIDLDDQED